MRTLIRHQPDRSTTLAAVAIVGLALAVRLAHAWWSARGPFGSEPLVDARTYHDLAVGLAAGGPLTEYLLWQAPFYPLLLAALYSLVGPSVLIPSYRHPMAQARHCAKSPVRDRSSTSATPSRRFIISGPKWQCVSIRSSSMAH